MESSLTHLRTRRLPALLVSLVFVAAACGNGASGNPSSAVQPTGVASVVPSAPAATFALPSFSPAALRWYCCLGTGEDPAQQPTEKDIAAKFADAFPGSSLKFEVVTYDSARDALATQIRGDNSPDIVGPVGIGGLAAFQGQWLDLAPVTFTHA